jgi:hypothetical protein
MQIAPRGTPRRRGKMGKGEWESRPLQIIDGVVVRGPLESLERPARHRVRPIHPLTLPRGLASKERPLRLVSEKGVPERVPR